MGLLGMAFKGKFESKSTLSGSLRIKEVVELDTITREMADFNNSLVCSGEEIHNMVSEATETALCSQGMVEELSKHVTEVIKQVGDTSSSLKIAKEFAEQGVASLQTANIEMEAIQERVLASIKITSRLQDDIKTLGDMLLAIKSIADQTKLLA
ncbi:hypothetical protein N752_28680 [Desulforamulus aquiferis]|nr:hypothetical protein [Desulforamulus aquiferis]RYD01553.1 hypothetical protein N752_28680 [Desulforamulus aquiferis]